MTIKVLTRSIEKDDLRLVLDYYNMNKETMEEPLELLNRCEIGFKINISYLKHMQGDENDKIKQVRWKKGCLTSNGFISFKEKEKMLLYEALAHVLGKDKVTIL
jgi:hypothetical protein